MLFSLPVGTEMFHFPTFPPHALYIQARVTRHHSCWVSPFGNPRITARLTAPRGISQPPTSFIGSWCQDIHRTLINTYNKDARVHCAVLKQHTTPDTHPTDRQELSRASSPKKHIACSLRTQQCTDITLFPPALGPAVTKKTAVSVPPMSSCRSTVGNETVSARDGSTCVDPRREMCSLERR